MMVENISSILPNRTCQPCSIKTLPGELIIKIFYNLSAKDLVSSTLTCKRWHTLIEAESTRDKIHALSLIVLIDSVSDCGHKLLPQLSQLRERLIEKDFYIDQYLESKWWFFYPFIGHKKASIFEKTHEMLSCYFNHIHLFHLQQIKTENLEGFIEMQVLSRINKIAKSCFEKRFSLRMITVSLFGFPLHPLYHNFLTKEVKFGPLEIGFPRFNIDQDLSELIDSPRKVIYASLPEKTPLFINFETIKYENVNSKSWDFLLKFLTKHAQSVFNLSLGNSAPLLCPWKGDFNQCINMLLSMKNLDWLLINFEPKVSDRHVRVLNRFLKNHQNELLLTIYDCKISLEGAMSLIRAVSSERQNLKTTLIIISWKFSESDITRLNEQVKRLKEKKHDFLFKNRYG